MEENRIVYVDANDPAQMEAMKQLLEQNPDMKVWAMPAELPSEGALPRPQTRVEWEPRSLGTTELRRVLRDALADLWADAWRPNDTRQHQGQEGRFAGVVEAEIFAAIGKRVRPLELLP